MTPISHLLLFAALSVPPPSFSTPVVCPGAQPRGDRGLLAFPSTPKNDLTPRAQVLHDDLVAGGFALFDQASRSDGPPTNAVFSPYVIQAAMAAVVAGAGGQTGAQLAAAMGWRLPAGETVAEMGALERRLLSQAAEERASSGQRRGGWPPVADPSPLELFRLDVATRLWPDETAELVGGYWHTMQHSGMSVDVQPLNYRTSPDLARQAINRWTAERTDNLIPNILPPGSIEERTRMTISTALYFQSRWQEAFQPLMPTEFQFSRPGHPSQPTAGMSISKRLPILETDTFTAVDVPYGGGKFSLLLVLPHARGDQAPPDITFTPADYRRFFEQAHRSEVRLSMPSFSLRQTSNLVETFRRLGATDAFAPELADFSPMLKRSPHEPNLFIDGIFKEAFLEVTPVGTRAGAAAAITCKFQCLPPPPIVVEVNRPFLFVLHDLDTQTPLFVGRLMDPSIRS